MPAAGEVLICSLVFLISFCHVGQDAASKTAAVINTNVGCNYNDPSTVKQIVTIIFSFLTMTAFSQTKGYSTLDNTYEYHFNEFNNHKLKGKIKSLIVYKKENSNFHSKNLAIKLDTRLADCHKYFIDSKQVSQIRFLNSDSTLRSKRVFSNELIREFVFYQPREKVQSRHIFVYNNSGQLTEKLIKDINDSIEFIVKYNYDKRNQLESVIGDERYNYKYIYDEFGGFYEVKYSEYNGQSTIHEIRYNKYSDTESLNVILQNEPKIKFEDIKNLKRNWQNMSKIDNYNRVVFEQSKDLKLNEIQIESSFTYNSDNHLISKAFKTKNGTNETYTFEYKEDKLIRQFAKDKNGIENFNRFLYYNEHGDLIKKHNAGVGIKEEVYTYEYTYDNNDNWTEKKEIVDGKLFEITYRQIEYEE